MISWSWGRGWGVYENVVCPQCGHVWMARPYRADPVPIGVAAVGSYGQGCPVCDYYDEDAVWPGDETEMPNDGAWLDGASMRWISVKVTEQEDHDEIEVTMDAPWEDGVDYDTDYDAGPDEGDDDSWSSDGPGMDLRSWLF